jgi:hypothetical protein
MDRLVRKSARSSRVQELLALIGALLAALNALSTDPCGV